LKPDLAILDYGGYPFILRLARHLAEDRQVIYAHAPCSRGPLSSEICEDVSGGLLIERVGLHLAPAMGFIGRARLEQRIGLEYVRLLERTRPTTVVATNMPLLAQRQILSWCRAQTVPCVHWLQDLLGPAARAVLKKKSFLLGSVVGWAMDGLERSLLRRASGVIAICPAFAEHALQAGVSDKNLSVLENWADIASLPVLGRDTRWRREQGWGKDRFVVTCSGNLGHKHNPQGLLDLAIAMQDEPRLHLQILGRGVGADWLCGQVRSRGLTSVTVRDLAPLERLQEVLCGSDALIATLDGDAGTYSVPSKILTYLCASRPVMLLARGSNPAMTLLQEHQLGRVIPPEDIDAAVSVLHEWLNTRELADEIGARARSYAESNFAMTRIATVFLESLNRTAEKA
jgi:colanic acid biosynthesis glycosyl transferase WcaI